jgi:hypothetical protein
MLFLFSYITVSVQPGFDPPRQAGTFAKIALLKNTPGTEEVII